MHLTSCARLPVVTGVAAIMLTAAPLQAQTSAPPSSTETPAPSARTTLSYKCHEVTEQKSKAGDTNWWTLSTTADWSGTCVDGAAQGFGRMTYVNASTNQFGKNTSTGIYEGMIAGTAIGGDAKVGMWCNISFVSDSESTIAGKYMKIHTDKPQPCTIANVSASYAHSFGWRHNQDGSWSAIQIGTMGLNAPLTVSAGTMETLLATLAHDPKIFPDFAFTTSLLDGLLPGGAATSLSDMSKPVDLASRRIALVLSSRTVTELARWGQQRDAFVKSRGYGKTFGSAGYNRDGERYDDSLAGHIAATDPAGFVPSVIAALQPTLGADANIVAAGDLSALTSGQADYAIVIDWSFEGGLLSPSQFEKMPFCDTASNTALCKPMFKDHWVAMVVDPKIKVAAIVTSDIGAVTRYIKNVYYDSVVRDIVAHLWRTKDYSNMPRIANQLAGRLPWARIEPLILRYLKGDGVKKNVPRAQELLNEAMQQKRPAAFRISADFARTLPGVDMSLSVVAGYQQGAELGDVESMISLTYLYASGAERVARDTAAAGRYAAMAYAARKTDVTTFNMGLSKAYGWAGPVDLPEALKLFEAAQALNYAPAAAKVTELRNKLASAAPVSTPTSVEAEFTASLQKIPSAGALFAKADELASQGETAKARAAFRALLTRFPSSPLAATAAQRLSGL